MLSNAILAAYTRFSSTRSSVGQSIGFLIRRSQVRILPGALLLAFLSAAAHASTVTINVAEDATVNRANPDGNLNSIRLLSGLDDTGSDYEFFLKFNLPAIDPATVTSARLIGTPNGDFDGLVESFHQFYFVPSDAWSETTITFNTKPATADAIIGAGFDASFFNPGEIIDLDITTAVHSELAGDRALSLRLGTIDGRLGDLEFFASRELEPVDAFRIELITVAAAVPLPAGWALGAALMPLAIRRGAKWATR